MTADELRAALDILHWTPAQLGAAACVARSTAHRWARGEIAVPERIAGWLTDLARYVAAHPPPEPPPPHPETVKQRARRAGYYVTGSREHGYRVAALAGVADPAGPDYRTRSEAWAAAAALASAEPSKPV
ncbi:MAG TPA: hypothetical protein VGR63_15375 [Casimicrobiaceae bacterium]|jgi:hypothetical protein|nr:hypothetical protein [Casimicrobiaceae bacterium]